MKSGRAALITASREPCACLALRLGDLTGSHFASDLGAALLSAGATRERCEIKPFMRFDEIDFDPPASRRKRHSELEQSIHIPGFGIS